MMTKNNNLQARVGTMSTSSTQFYNHNFQKQRYNPFSNFNNHARMQENYSNAHPRPIVSQSMIGTNSTRANRANFSKLDSMARVATQTYQEDSSNTNLKRQIYNFSTVTNKNQNIITLTQNQIKSPHLFNPFQAVRNHNQKQITVQNTIQRQPNAYAANDIRLIKNQQQMFRDRMHNIQLEQIKIQNKPFTEKSPMSVHSSHSAQLGNLQLPKKTFQFWKNRKQVTMNQKTKEHKDVFIDNQGKHHLQQFNSNHTHFKTPQFLKSTTHQSSANESLHLDQKQKISHPIKSQSSTEPQYTANIEFNKKILKQSPPQSGKINSKLQFAGMKKSMNSTQIITARQRRNCKPQRQIKLSDFQLLDKLGKGAFGDVYMAQQKNIGFICVIKKMSKQRIKDRKVQEHILRQIKIQLYLNHRNLTALYGYFQDQENIYLILEALPDGSLQQIRKNKKLPEKQTAEIIRQVSQGLKYMHQEYIIHRDLKPENLFVNQKLVKLGDFGCSIYNRDLVLRNTVVGCLQYSSPEQLSQEGYSEKIDSWSLGILTYELLYGKSPFKNDIIKISMNKDQKAELSQLQFPENVAIEKKTRDFIENLLNENPKLRMDMEGVLRHPFLNQTQQI